MLNIYPGFRNGKQCHRLYRLALNLMSTLVILNGNDVMLLFEIEPFVQMTQVCGIVCCWSELLEDLFTVISYLLVTIYIH